MYRLHFPNVVLLIKIYRKECYTIMTKILNLISMQDFGYYIVGVITVLSIIVENISKFPFKPWSQFFEWLGKCLTKSVNLKLVEIEKQQIANKDAIIELEKKVEKKFAEKQEDDDTKEAKRLRARIIEFADSCRVGNHHTQNHFENVFRDYSDYIDYCDRHSIPNHFIESEYRYIEQIYQECLKENKFL